MLGALRALLPGAAFAQQLPPPISLWSFDGTAGPSFADIGPANVPMTIIGTWADLTTGSLVQGVGGTSAYTDGSGYATIPANDPDHNLSELTISFYYQRNSAAAKHILLAAGNGSQPGDFSIEVLANGRLRGYHVGQDAQLRFFESTSGITNSDLQVGTAYRIDLTLGSLGARIYLDGAPLTSAFILANTNSWNNSQVKFLGVFTNGASAPADGAFDRLRLWNQQLNSAQIATLEPAQSITITHAPEQLSVPSLAEWLVSDESNPTPTKYVSNQNRGNGSGSSPANAQEVQSALNGASAGQTFLAVCQTPGTIEYWNYPNGLVFPSGDSGNRITLQARQGDGVVIHAGGAFTGAATPNSGFWTQSGLSQADINNKIWRSANTFTGGAQNMMGVWFEFEQPHQLLPAGSMTNLRAAYGTGDSPGNYAAPMVYKDSDNRVYIRFQKTHPGKYSAGNKWSAQTWPGYPEAISGGQIVYPLSEDPNDYAIHLYRVTSDIAAFRTGQWIKIGAGINSCGYRWAIEASNILVDRGLHITWRNGIKPSGVGDTRTNIFCNRARFTDGSKIHANRAEWKFGGWLESGFRSAFVQQINSNTMTNLYFKDCTIGHYHELWVNGYKNFTNGRFRNCTFVSILDDGFQWVMTNSNMEVGYCYYHNSAYGGFGENIAEESDPNPGGWFFHHNIVDYRQERGTEWRAQPHPGFVYAPHSPNGSRPQKTYNNLIIWGPDTENKFGPGLEHSSQATAGNNSSSVMHEVFNNILLRVHFEGTKRYTPWVGQAEGSYSDSGFTSGTGNYESDYVLGTQDRYSATESNELFDYNCYWRPASMTTDPLILGRRRGGTQTQRNFNSLAEWRAHSEFGHSKLGGVRRGPYSPGYDGNSTDSKPTLPSIDNYPNARYNYRPTANSVITTATSSSLSGENWWSTPPSWGATYFSWNEGEKTLAPSPWKGALDPSGSTLPIGVQNP